MTLPGSGLSAQFGIATEATPLTPNAVTRFIEFDSETLALKRHIAQGVGLRSGKLFSRGARRILVAREAAGDVLFDVPSNGLGVFLQHMIGSFTTVATQIGTTAAWQQIHNTGSLQGKTFTAQKGAPSTDGTVNPFTYPGCKIADWDLVAAMHKQVTLKLTIDAVDELPAGAGASALQTAVYGAGTGLFSFKDAQVLSGGTVSTVAGVLTATGTAVASCRNINLKGVNPFKNDRFFAGSQTKAESLENNVRAYTGALDLEFASMSTYNQYRVDGATVLQVNFTGPLITGTPTHEQLSFFYPYVAFDDSVSPTIAGPDIIIKSVPFTALDDGTNGALQVVYVSSDVAV